MVLAGAVPEVVMDQDKLRVLSRPFTDIKTRPGRNGQGISYVEGHQDDHRLN